MTLFDIGDFTLHSGEKSHWKIDCDALTDDDISVIAMLMHNMIGPATGVKKVIGIPKGGLRLANEFINHVNMRNYGQTVIVDDVLTTGKSMWDMRAKHNLIEDEAVGLVIFARGKCPWWVHPLFQYKGV